MEEESAEDQSDRKEFEGYILNNRIDDPCGGSLSRDGVFGFYEDPRIGVGWACWQAAKKHYAQEV